MKLIDVIGKSGLNFLPSNSEARRLAKQGGIYIDGEKVEDIDQCLPAGEYTLKVGKRKFAKLAVS